MDERTPRNVLDDLPVTDNGHRRPPRDDEADDRRTEKHRHLEEYRTQRLADRDPRRACLGNIEADLIEIAQEMGPLVAEEVREQGAAGAPTVQTAPAVALYLQVVRGVGQFAALETKLDRPPGPRGASR